MNNRTQHLIRTFHKDPINLPSCTINPFPNDRQILDSSKPKESADDNFKFDENVQTGRKHCGKRRNCSLRAISPFPTVFFKGLVLQTCKNQDLFGKGLRSSIKPTGLTN